MADRHETDAQETVERIARRASASGLRVAVAESLTSGAIAVRLGAGPDASSWFAGSVVAYHESVKFRVLGVPEGPVATPECAESMASGVRRLMDADVAIAVTGVGGPEPSEGKPPGTVYVAARDRLGPARLSALRLEGDPRTVVAETVRAALVALEEALPC